MIFSTTIVATFILAIMLLVVSKKHLLLPFILAACFIPADQRILIFDLDFQPIRILILIGFIRMILYGEQRTFKLNMFDKYVFAWAIINSIMYVILWPNMGAFIYKCGFLFDVIGLYWLFRLNINSIGNLKEIVNAFAISALILALLVALEWHTGRNPFVVMGKAGTAVRAGRYRCQASFPHSIMLGLFWSTLMPLFIGFSRIDSKKKWLYWVATFASGFIVAATASSTPYITLIMIIFMLCWYKWRQYTRYLAWCVFICLVGLHIIMSEPVWSLIAKMSIVPGSTGMHRYNVINQAVVHFREWALIGTQSTLHWGQGLSDITNMYVGEGVRGGFITLLCLLIVLFVSMKSLLGLSLKWPGKKMQFLIWCLFVVMAGHAVAFFGVSYFGQIRMWWFMSLAIVSYISEMKTYVFPITVSNQLNRVVDGASSKQLEYASSLR